MNISPVKLDTSFVCEIALHNSIFIKLSQTFLVISTHVVNELKFY